MILEEIFETYKKFSVTEKKRFHQFVKSPYHNSNEHIVTFCKVLYKSKVLPDKKQLYNLIWGKLIYKDANIRQLYKFFGQLLRSFLALELLQQDKFTMPLLSIKALQQKGAKKLVLHTLKQVHEDVNASQLKNSEFWYQKFNYETIVQEALHTSKRDKESNLSNQLDALELFYLAEKLKIMNMMLAHQNVFKTDYQILLKQEILALANIEKFKNIKAIKYFQLAYLCFEDFENETYYKELSNHVNNSLEVFNNEEQRMLLVTLINYCIKKINSKSGSFREELLKWYQFGIENSILFENNLLTHYTYTNTITVAILLKKYDWVKQFIEDYKIALEPNIREIYYQYNLSKYYYEVQDYKLALRILHRHDFEDKLLIMSAKILLLKILYETADFSSLESVLESTKMLLYREKNVNYHKDSFLNFIKILQAILLLNSKSKKEKLSQKIEALPTLTEKKWLLKQIEILKY